MPKLRESEVLARRFGKTCRNCTGAVTNLPMSHRLYCIRGGQRRVAVGRDHTCKYFERK